MPRAFTTEESARIRERLLNAGREAFARSGVRGTTVEELAKAAAISKGAFYRFFDGKEALLVALLGEHERAEHARIEQAVRADPAHVVDVLVDSAVCALERDPFLAVLMSEEGLRAVHSRPLEEQEALLERDSRLVKRVFAVLQEAGMVLDVSEQVLLGLLRSLIFTGWHRTDIGDEHVEELTAWLKTSLRRDVHVEVRE
ncbi:TetR/AcrR family transcriptional regulator [Actinocorallia populi]|uniref:TetR/AcrR family transcriptional regulator n=1 Tax=Actinocorallia populi TaxID=2079200 RepID=UPI000D0937C4|nr:TetR/AcrR family transcriptional regulator [Actinocorallia populi]